MKIYNYLEVKIAIKCFLDGVGNITTLEILLQGLYENGWTIYPVTYKCQIIGAIVERNGEIHTSIAPKFQKKWNPRPYIRSILYPALDKYGVLYSDAEKGDNNAIRWLTKLGFEYLKEDNERIYYKLTTKKF